MGKIWPNLTTEENNWSATYLICLASEKSNDKAPILKVYWVELSHPIYCPDEFRKKIFLLEMVKNGICFGSVNKQNSFFSKQYAPNNAPMLSLPKIGHVFVNKYR